MGEFDRALKVLNTLDNGKLPRLHRRCSLTSRSRTTAAFRIKPLVRGIQVRNPLDGGDRKVLIVTDSWENAIEHTLFGFVVLPAYGNRGLSLNSWQTLWDDGTG
jgi:hypothetical protein